MLAAMANMDALHPVVMSIPLAVGSNGKHRRTASHGHEHPNTRCACSCAAACSAQPHLPPGRYSSTSMYGLERVHAPRNCTRFGWCICMSAQPACHTTAAIIDIVSGQAPAPEAQDVAPD